MLAGDPAPGTDVVTLLGLRDEVLDIAVTPDRGYCLSVRGVAREAAGALGVDLVDPASLDGLPVADGAAWEVRVQDPGACDRYVARRVTGLDPSAVSPAWLQRRLVLAGMRPVSLAVDVTNHVMLELGQPLHAFDAVPAAGPGRGPPRRPRRDGCAPWTASTGPWTRRTWSSPTTAARSRWPG